MARVISVPVSFFITGCHDTQDVRRPGVYFSDYSPLAQLWDDGSETSSSEGPDGNETCRLLESPPGGGGGSYPPQGHGTIIAFIKTYIVSGICVFGIFGNLLTFLVLSRKRLEVICDGAERSVHFGLRTLAATDLLLCIILLPHGLLGEERIAYPTKNFELIYRSYSGAVINTFILTSTWLTVTMATSRYLAICRPFRMLRLVSVSGTKVTIVCVCLCCVVFNVPRFFEHDIETLVCDEGRRQIYVQNLGYLTQNHLASTVYAWIYFGFGIVCPLSTLAVCNIGLVRALRESSRIRQMYRVPAKHLRANHRITTTLVTIIVTYIVLVSPAELLLFVQNQLPLSSRKEWLVVAVNVTNVLQTINFSFNFILYVVLNFHFRRAVADLICCWKRGGWCWTTMPLRRSRDPVHHKDVFLIRQVSMRTFNTVL